MELVSILMPSRNAAPWIGRALESALGQTGCRVEVIVVDDGSTDGSYGIARQFASARCRVVRQEPRGASVARNRALGLAQGDFIQYLDADDLLAPDKIARQLDILRHHGPRVLGWGTVVHLLEGREDGRSHTEMARPAEAGGGAAFLARLWGATGEPGMIAVHQWLVPRALIAEAGGWNETLTADDDGEFFARVVLAAKGGLPVPEARCYYRKSHHAGSISQAMRHNARHRRSAMEAACLKAGHLLAAMKNEASRRAVSRLLTQQIVDAYPDPVHRIGLDFLRRHDLPLAEEINSPPWFQRWRARVGWKAARLVQDLARGTRKLGACSH